MYTFSFENKSMCITLYDKSGLDIIRSNLFVASLNIPSIEVAHFTIPVNWYLVYQDSNTI